MTVIPEDKVEQPESDLISTRQAAEILGVSKRYVIRLLNRDILKGTLLSRQWVVYRESVEEFKRTREAGKQSESE